MKKIEFKKDSWHYKFVDKTTNYLKEIRWDNEIGGTSQPDICAYTRAFLGGLTIVLVVTIVLTALATVLISPIVYGIAWLLHYSWILIYLERMASVGAGMWILITIVCCGFLLTHLKEKFRNRNTTPKPPGALTVMYRHWKEKTCAQIEFK